MADQTDIKAIAEAAAEGAKFGTQTVKTSEKILGFLARLFKEPAEDTMGIIGDRLKFLRWERQLHYVEEVNKMLEVRGIAELERYLQSLLCH